MEATDRRRKRPAECVRSGRDDPWHCRQQGLCVRRLRVSEHAGRRVAFLDAPFLHHHTVVGDARQVGPWRQNAARDLRRKGSKLVDTLQWKQSQSRAIRVNSQERARLQFRFHLPQRGYHLVACHVRCGQHDVDAALAQRLL